MKEEHPSHGAPIPQAQAGADTDFGDGERDCVSLLSRGPLPTLCPCYGWWFPADLRPWLTYQHVEKANFVKDVLWDASHEHPQNANSLPQLSLNLQLSYN